LNEQKLKFEMMSKNFKYLSATAVLVATLYVLLYWLKSRQPKVSDILTPAPDGELQDDNPIDAASPASPFVTSGSSLTPTENVGMSSSTVNDLIPTKSDKVVSSPGVTPKTVIDGLGTTADLNPSAVKSLANQIKIAATTPIIPGSGFIAPTKAVTTSVLKDLTPKKVVSTSLKKPAIQVVSPKPIVKPAISTIAKLKPAPIVRSVSLLKKQKMAAADAGYDMGYDMESEYNR
jgi:hypothetical protein